MKKHWRRCVQGAIISVFVVYLTFTMKQAVLTFIDIGKDEMPSSDKVVTTLTETPKYLSLKHSSNVVNKTNVPTTSKRPQVGLDDIFISVKTSGKFHQNRLDIIVKTWFLLARQQTWFFTDKEDSKYHKATGGHVIDTHCSTSHGRRDLCCKMSVEFDAFMDSNKRWFCHFDDDNYVNVPQLVKLLELYDPMQEWYLGRKSVKKPLKVPGKGAGHTFWFATGGAGFCISRPLALRMVPVAGGGRFVNACDKIGLPDDVTMGYVIEYVLKKNLTVINTFHSHLESMKLLKLDELQDQISFGYTPYNNERANVINIDGFNVKIDPTRFLSLHCHLFPNFSFCRK